MPQVEVVTGAPFSGKSLYIGDEIERREEEGELGLVALDFTGIYAAVVPGSESALRDGPVSDSGAPRFVGHVFSVAVAAVAARELSGYIATNSPKRAVELAERFGGRLVNVDVGIEDLATRIQAHQTQITRKVRRATRASVERRCRDAAGRYLSEAPALVGKARQVRKVGKRWRDDGPVKPFDRSLYLRGTTPAAREVIAQLEADGIDDWTPTHIFDRLLLEKQYGR